MGKIGIARWVLGLVFVSALVFAGTASATTLTVTSTTDSNNPGSLRYEIGQANPGDTVMVPASTSPYTITMTEIPIANAITIEGAGAGSTTIEVMGGGRAFEFTGTGTIEFENLTIKGGAVTTSPGGGGILVDAGLLDLSGVTMTGNSVNLGSDIDSDVGGGAIYSTGGNITITDSTLNDNSFTDTGGNAADNDLGGAAVYEEGNGSISITGSTIDSNTVSVGTSRCCDGGAVYQNVNAPLTITGSHLDGNQLTVTGSTNCCSGGAAVYNDGSNLATTTISSSTLSNDTVAVTDSGPTNACCDGGGALYQNTSSGSSLMITQSMLDNDKATVTGDVGQSGGGAISSFVPVTVSASTLDSNTSDVTDGGCCDGGGAIDVDAQATSSATNSELSGNTSTVDWTGATTANSAGLYDGGGAVQDESEGFALTGSDLSGNTSNLSSNVTDSGGGGLYEDSGTPETITNSTLSGNTTNAAGATNGGGAVYFFTPFGENNLLSFDTIAGNSAPSASGGALFAFGTGNSIKASIVAANTAPSGKDCAGVANGANAFTFTSAGYNLEDSPDTCTFTQPTDKVVATGALGLGPLANNGGSTMTRSLLLGSPAVNAVPPASCTDQTSPTPVAITTDQRGITRPQPPGGNCDIGAFEFGDSDVSLTGTAVPSPATVTVGQKATVNLTVANAGPLPATATTVSLALPKGLKLISATPGTGSCVDGTCSLGALAVGSRDQIAVVIEPTAPGAFNVRATAATTSDDPNAANNSASFVLNGTLKPTLTHVSQSHKTWSEGSKLAHLAGKHKTKKPPTGTIFSFTLNESAKVTFAFEQGHKTRGTLTYNAKSGKRKLSFDGKLSRSKKLKPGSYTVVITAKATGLTSKTAKLSFKIAAG